VAIVIDSDVVVGFIDRSDALHKAADAALRDLATSQPLFVSVITYAEVLTGARIGHHPLDAVDGFFEDVISQIIPVDVEVGDRAADLLARAKALKMPDALILASADTHPKVELLLSADRDLAKLRGLRCEVRLISASR
jgi:predicted nucleic acid-binding protein